MQYNSQNLTQSQALQQLIVAMNRKEATYLPSSLTLFTVKEHSSKAYFTQEFYNRVSPIEFNHFKAQSLNASQISSAVINTERMDISLNPIIIRLSESINSNIESLADVSWEALTLMLKALDSSIYASITNSSRVQQYTQTSTIDTLADVLYINKDIIQMVILILRNTNTSPGMIKLKATISSNIVALLQSTPFFTGASGGGMSCWEALKSSLAHYQVDIEENLIESNKVYISNNEFTTLHIGQLPMVDATFTSPESRTRNIDLAMTTTAQYVRFNGGIVYCAFSGTLIPTMAQNDIIVNIKSTVQSPKVIPSTPEIQEIDPEEKGKRK